MSSERMEKSAYSFNFKMLGYVGWSLDEGGYTKYLSGCAEGSQRDACLIDPRAHMANKLRIRINWPRLLANLSKQEGRAMSRDEVRQWLVDAGFTHDEDDFWIVKEPDLGHLDPTEVISVEDA